MAMKVYADNAATTKMSRVAIDTMLSLMEEEYGNPSSLYSFGQEAKEILEAAQAELIIPMNPNCESLNAAIAAAIVMWQMK